MSANSQVARNQSRQTFDSVYESTNPLTTVAGQRVVEWFTGNSLNTDRWTLKLNSDPSTDPVFNGMDDSVNGGFKFLMTNGHEGTYDFNNKRQYNYDGAVIIGICKRNHADGIFGIGFRGDRDVATNRSYTRLFIKNGSNNIEGMTADGSGVTYFDTGVTSDGNLHNLKIELSGTTAFSIDGVLKATSTGSQNETDEKVQPNFFAYGEGSSQGGNIIYLEAYNT